MITVPEGVHHIRRCRVRRSTEIWPFASREEDAIRSHWTQRSANNPKYFNGRVYVMTSGALREDCLEGSLAARDFAASLYWRETGYRDRTVVDCFGSAILLGSDGTLIYGRQTPGNINSGKLYPAGGFIDRRDFDMCGTVDFDGSIAREVAEEMGLDPSTLDRDAGYLVTKNGPLLSVGIIYRLAVPGHEFCAQVKARLASDAAPELEGLVTLACAAEAVAHAMPGYARQIATALLPG